MALALRATLEEAAALKATRDNMREGDVHEVEGESLPTGRPMSF